MSGGIIVPSGIGSSGRKPTLVEYVESYVTKMRAPLKERTVFSRAGRTVIHDPGERIIYGPKGQKIRVLDTQHGTNVEHGNEHGRGVEHNHVHVRPECVTLSLNQIGGDLDEFTRQREQARINAGRRIFIPRG